MEEVIQNSKMHRVLATGLPEMADLWESNGQKFVISRLPLLWEGQVVGAVASLAFRNLDEARLFARRLEQIFPEPERDGKGPRELPARGFDGMVAQSPIMQQALRLTRMAARSNSTVLITGETGTGKEVFAQAMHRDSPRSQGPFVKVNCAALPRDLLESELFGYEDGAFTGARRGGKPGKFELASGGTLLLDEIGDMPLELQPKLLRVLQDMQVDRLGGTRPVKVDVRLVAATNADLEQMVREGRFRADLYYRLSVVAIALPPLRERLEEVPALAQLILARLNHQMGARVEGLTPDALDLLQAYNWPGNIRELENILERALNVIHSDVITREHLLLLAPRLAVERPAPKTWASAPGSTPVDLRACLQDAEHAAILRALTLAAGNKTQAAELLGIHRTVLHEKIKKYNLTCPVDASGL